MAARRMDMYAISSKWLTEAIENYFADLGQVKASGSATAERCSYGPSPNLLSAVGGTLQPKVSCVQELADQGAGRFT